jgi:hypothetical protein
MRRMFGPMAGLLSALSVAAVVQMQLVAPEAVAQQRGLGPSRLPFFGGGGSRKGHSWERSRKLKGYRRDHQRKRCHGRWKAGR